MKLKVLIMVMLTTILTLMIPFLSNLSMAFVGARLTGGLLSNNVLMILTFYIVQNILAILWVRFALRYSLSDMGYTMKNWKTTMKQVRRFVAIWFPLVIAFYTIGLVFISGFEDYIHTYYVKDTTMFLKNLIGGCLLAGIGEEGLFRGLVLVTLMPLITKEIPIGRKYRLPITALISGVLFSIAHIVYEVSPFRVVRIDYLQLLFTFTLGTIWATMYIKTKNLWGTIIAHTLANTIQIMTGYVVAYFIL